MKYGVMWKCLQTEVHCMLITNQAGNVLSHNQGQAKEVINTRLVLCLSLRKFKTFKRITRKGSIQRKYLFDPRKDIQAKLFTQTPLMKTDLAHWSVLMFTQREVFLKGGLSLFLMSCHIKTSEGQQQTAAWMSGTL